jgi:hypothetical protein
MWFRRAHADPRVNKNEDARTTPLPVFIGQALGPASLHQNPTGQPVVVDVDGFAITMAPRFLPADELNDVLLSMSAKCEGMVVEGDRYETICVPRGGCRYEPLTNEPA